MPTTNWQDLFNKAQEENKKYAALPAADYDVVCVKSEATRTKDGRKDAFKLQLKVIDGEHKGRILWDQLTVSEDNPKAMAVFFDRFGAFDMTIENFFSKDPSNEEIAAGPLGKVIRVQVEVGEWQGKANNNIKAYKKAPDSALAAGARVYAEGPASSSGVPSPTPTPTPTAAPTPSGVPAPPAPSAPSAPAADAGASIPPPPPQPY